MKNINSHVHSTGSDGKLSPKAVIELAIKNKLDYICFTDHYKRPFDDGGWSKDFFNEKYKLDIKKLQNKYKKKIDICFGIELDWFSEYQDFIKEVIRKNDFDYILGSIHRGKTPDGIYLGVNTSKEVFEENIIKFKGIKPLVQEYYRELRDLAGSSLFDCIGHLDVIKTFNENSRYFNENDPWYKKEIYETLKQVKKNKVAIELNTSGLTYPCKEFFPSLWIIKIAKKLDIPITLSSDSHFEYQIAYKLDEAKKLLKKIGYKEIVIYKKRRPYKIKI